MVLLKASGDATQGFCGSWPGIQNTIRSEEISFQSLFMVPGVFPPQAQNFSDQAMHEPLYWALFCALIVRFVSPASRNKHCGIALWACENSSKNQTSIP